ncbi:DUF2790 domain-containing protein [Pseudomonas matsuisoli]|uniref:DUF2790 domain-containing protein n=1 Tax=Pseudomonas matsuisoli TaxID=1515666 RepID=A0A917UTE6_9PSED|nr:DUF2790 domain-containing protein [Pseudomonas matsuisoli]GGJ83764.1 hypothetical protein GCM10009304_07180 [Pseudomonas matsuisoli]
MKTHSVVSALIASLIAPAVFASSSPSAADVPVVDYRYGMKLDIEKVVHRTDNSKKAGVVPTIVTYQDHSGAVHKVRFLEWGGRTSDQA